MKKILLSSVVVMLVFIRCGTVQSIIKSSFPYTATLVVPASSATGTNLNAISEGSSFDQNFVKDGNNGGRISNVRIVSAKITAVVPSDFNIGNLISARVYMAKANGADEVLVGSRTDIGPNSGSSIVLDIDNSNMLDELMREKKVRIRMAYVLRNRISLDASLRIVLGIAADPAR
ncbi:hypothetical protein DYU05_11865 [Mucilaginibacter terrenus]|uniref:Uncharacterized protein n=1 Tax=Mucilaginibacter terrenus TaxID=2482727 RepID=A0A3E2NPE3_9SPHI|nr:hypothetical protein [Mucilaginibacter terrenus]RFZ82852.1 hypothetical protein DYU05_11865 [Mucilaginibacter terrenus]